jgi:hypothetical protein
VEHVSELPAAAADTCGIRMKEGRLPDLDALGRHLSEMRVGASLRGVEATIRGSISRNGETIWMAFGADRARLLPARRSVHRDVKRKQLIELTSEERAAHAQLVRRTHRVLEVTGTLGRDNDGWTLEVRRFKE